LTTICSEEPVEFSTLTSCHNFNLQLEGTLLVQWAGGSGQTQLVVPGHVSLNVAGEPFKAVVWPAKELLTLHVRIPPSLIARVREEELNGRHAHGDVLTPSMGEWNTRIRESAFRIAEAVRLFGTSERLLLDQLLQSLVVELVCRHDGPYVRPHVAGRMAVCKLRDVIEYMHEHIGDTIQLADLAAVADLSPFHFARSFKSSIGVTPHRYLTEIRLERARLHLATTNRPITVIALSLGFDTHSHFCNVFRANVGESPSSFRLRNS
jgi:AraC family transcriptional regulator